MNGPRQEPPTVHVAIRGDLIEPTIGFRVPRYARDPHPGWSVRLTFPDGTVHHDAIRAPDRAEAERRARWNWPAAADVQVGEQVDPPAV